MINDYKITVEDLLENDFNYTYNKGKSVNDALLSGEKVAFQFVVELSYKTYELYQECLKLANPRRAWVDTIAQLFVLKVLDGKVRLEPCCQEDNIYLYKLPNIVCNQDDEGIIFEQILTKELNTSKTDNCVGRFTLEKVLNYVLQQTGKNLHSYDGLTTYACIMFTELRPVINK